MLTNLTSSVRFPGALNVDLNEIALNLVPFPRMHFLLPALRSVRNLVINVFVVKVIISLGFATARCIKRNWPTHAYWQRQLIRRHERLLNSLLSPALEALPSADSPHIALA